MKRHTPIGAESLESALSRNPPDGFLTVFIEVTR